MGGGEADGVVVEAEAAAAAALVGTREEQGLRTGKEGDVAKEPGTEEGLSMFGLGLEEKALAMAGPATYQLTVEDLMALKDTPFREYQRKDKIVDAQGMIGTITRLINIDESGRQYEMHMEDDSTSSMSAFKMHEQGIRPYQLEPRVVDEVWQRDDLPAVDADLPSAMCSICLSEKSAVFSCLARRGKAGWGSEAKVFGGEAEEKRREEHGDAVCRVTMCEECLAEYLDHFITGSRYTAAPLHCPGCSRRVPMRVWSALTHDSRAADGSSRRLLPLPVLNSYINNPQALMTLRCESCDQPGDVFARVCLGDRRKKVVETLEKKLTTSQQTQLMGLWDGFETDGSFTASAFMNGMMRVLQFFPGTDDLEASADVDSIMKSLLSLIVDVERRCTLNLSWVRRFPFLYTRCCSIPMCFKCKTHGFHEDQTCAERQAQELEVEAQYCPECGVATIRSEGCSHMICVCGASWTWDGDDY